MVVPSTNASAFRDLIASPAGNAIAEASSQSTESDQGAALAELAGLSPREEVQEAEAEADA